MQLCRCYVNMITTFTRNNYASTLYIFEIKIFQNNIWNEKIYSRVSSNCPLLCCTMNFFSPWIPASLQFCFSYYIHLRPLRTAKHKKWNKTLKTLNCANPPGLKAELLATSSCPIKIITKWNIK